MKDSFKIKFRGVRGSFPVADKDFLKYGGNTSCVEISVGGKTIIIDAGTGIVNVGNDLMKNYISSAVEPNDRKHIEATIFLSHIHQDHILGLTFFNPIHLKSSDIKIYGPAECGSTLKYDLSNLVFGKTFPIDLEDVCCKLEINDLPENGQIILNSQDEDKITVDFYKSYVHPQNGVMIFRISYKNKAVIYASDKESFMGGDKKFLNFAKNCDVLIHDSQYTTEDYLNIHSPKQGYGHSTYEMAFDAMRQTDAKNLVFFHYDPSYDDEKLDRIKDHYCTGHNNILMAYEGMEINLL